MQHKSPLPSPALSSSIPLLQLTQHIPKPSPWVGMSCFVLQWTKSGTFLVYASHQVMKHKTAAGGHLCFPRTTAS